MTGTTATRALIYVHAPTQDAAVQAAEAGHRFAEARGYQVIDTITDPFGENDDPARRPGWQRLVQLAEKGEFERLIVHLPGYVSRDTDRRYEALNGLRKHGVRSLHSWPGQGPHERTKETAR